MLRRPFTISLILVTGTRRSRERPLMLSPSGAIRSSRRTSPGCTGGNRRLFAIISSCSATRASADRSHLEQCAGGGVGLGPELHRHAVLPARHRAGNAVLLVELLRRVVLERFSRDLLIVDEHVEHAPSSLAATIRGDDRDRRIAGDLQFVTEPAASRLARLPPFEEPAGRVVALQRVRPLA